MVGVRLLPLPQHLIHLSSQFAAPKPNLPILGSYHFPRRNRMPGIEASPSFVREPEGNGVAERFIRTLKENLLWVTTFDTIEELRAALVEFATRYNETWLVARHGYRTPAQVRADQCRLDPNTTADLRLAA
jgi:hypothetical protein